MFNNTSKRVFLLFCLFIFIETSSASYTIVNDGIINDKVSNKIEQMGKEVFLKTSVSIYLAAPKSLDGKTIIFYEQNISKRLKNPYILLTLAKNEKQVDIIYSASLEGKIDTDSILSPFPWNGTILPLLAVHKNNDQYNAAMINGYSDIAEKIAASYNVELNSAIGNTNRDILHYIKWLILLFVVYIFGNYILRKVRKNGN